MSAAIADPCLDHDASLSRLSDWSGGRTWENTFDFTEESRRYRQLLIGWPQWRQLLIQNGNSWSASSTKTHPGAWARWLSDSLSH